MGANESSAKFATREKRIEIIEKPHVARAFPDRKKKLDPEYGASNFALTPGC